MFLRASLLLMIPLYTWGQGIQTRFEKDRDYTIYKTFSFGEGEIITPKDQRQIDDQLLHRWIRDAVAGELQQKGLQPADSLGDLVISYIVGATTQLDFQNLGPLGTAPGNPSQTWSQDVRTGSLVIDLNDRNGFLIWRIDATMALSAGAAVEKQIDQVVFQGYKKWPKPKKKKK